MGKYLRGDLIINTLRTHRDITDEYVSDIDIDIPLANEVKFELMGNDYRVDKLHIRNGWYGEGLEICYVINGFRVELGLYDGLILEVIDILESNYGEDKPLKNYNFEDYYEDWLSEQGHAQWYEDKYGGV